MKGRRIETPPTEWSAGRVPWEPGDYWRADDGTWYVVTPNGLRGWLKNHYVIEHGDGTVSVPLLNPNGGANSILVSNGSGNKSWHGSIDHGVWVPC